MDRAFIARMYHLGLRVAFNFDQMMMAAANMTLAGRDALPNDTADNATTGVPSRISFVVVFVSVDDKRRKKASK